MALNYGIKSLKTNAPSEYDVFNAPIRYLTILSSVESHKMAFEGVNNSSTTGVTHSLGYIPFFNAFYEETNGDLYPMAYIDDQYFDSMYMQTTTSALYLYKYNKARYYAIFFE